MNGITLKTSSYKKRLRISFLIISTLFLYTNAFSRQHWHRGYFDVIHSIADNYIEMVFKFFDYDFGPCGENGYLRTCYFQFSNDGLVYQSLFNVYTRDQRHIDNWTWMTMSSKLREARIQFGKCFTPGPGIFWAEENKKQRIEVTNTPDGDRAWFNVIWHLEKKYQDVKYIRLSLIWHVNGIYTNDIIYGEVFQINKFIISEMKTGITDSEHLPVITPLDNQPENNSVKVSKELDAIVVKGAVRGENIKVYTTSGALIKSIIATNEVEKIKLASNQIYIVNIAQNRHRVAL